MWKISAIVAIVPLKGPRERERQSPTLGAAPHHIRVIAPSLALETSAAYLAITPVR